MERNSPTIKRNILRAALKILAADIRRGSVGLEPLSNEWLRVTGQTTIFACCTLTAAAVAVARDHKLTDDDIISLPDSEEDSGYVAYILTKLPLLKDILIAFPRNMYFLNDQPNNTWRTDISIHLESLITLVVRLNDMVIPEMQKMGFLEGVDPRLFIADFLEAVAIEDHFTWKGADDAVDFAAP